MEQLRLVLVPIMDFSTADGGPVSYAKVPVSKMAIFKETKIRDIGKNMKKNPCTLDGNGNEHSHFGNSVAVP